MCSDLETLKNLEKREKANKKQLVKEVIRLVKMLGTFEMDSSQVDLLKHFERSAKSIVGIKTKRQKDEIICTNKEWELIQDV